MYCCLLTVAMTSPLTLLIGYYHGVLLKDINANLLLDEMCSEDLLNAHEQNVISAGHSIHHRNWLILEHVRYMDTKAFLAFCKLVQKLWPLIGSQLIAGMCKLHCVHTYVQNMYIATYDMAI